MSNVIKKLGDKDIAKLVFFHSTFENAINLPFMCRDDLSEINLLNTFSYTIQSYKNIQINVDKSFSVVIIIARLPSGGRKRKNLLKKQNYYSKKVKDYVKDNDIKKIKESSLFLK